LDYCELSENLKCHNELSHTPVRKTDTKFSQCVNWSPIYFVGVSSNFFTSLPPYYGGRGEASSSFVKDMNRLGFQPGSELSYETRFTREKHMEK